jgi:hypothetical protein
MFRRLASVAVLALVGGLALAGCQAAPSSVAAQISDFKVTNEQVDQIVQQIDDQVAAARQKQATTQAQASPGVTPAPTASAQGLAKDQIGDVRATVVQLAVFDELARRVAAGKGLSLPIQNYKAAAQQIGLHEDNPYIKLAVDADAYRTLLLSKTQPATPTEADLQQAYRKVAAGGGQIPSYEELKPQLQALPALGEGIGLRTELLAAASQYGLVVNPRYQPLEMPLAAVTSGQSQVVLVSLPLGTPSGSPAVRDLASAR